MSGGPMLSRVADHLYWLSRYLERAEHTARLLEISAMLLPDRESLSWENRLDYAIGRLLFSASLRISEANRNQIRLLMLRVQRDFDGVAFR